MPVNRVLGLVKGGGITGVLARGGLLAFLIQGAGAALYFLVEVVAARLLGVNQFGIYALVTAWLYILLMVGTLSLNHMLLRFVPTYLAQEDWGGLRGVLRRSNQWAGAAGIVLACGGAALLSALHGCCVETVVVAAFLPALIALPFQVLSSLRQATLRGMEKIAHALLPEFVLRPLLFLLLLGAAACFVDRPPDAEMAFFLNLAAVIAAFATGAIWQRRHLPTRVRDAAPAYRDREWLLTALSLLLVVGLNLISSRLDVVMLGMLSGAREVGVYSAASRVADVITFGLACANAVAAPMIARLHATGRQQELQQLVRQAARGVFLFTLPVAFLVVVFGREILGLFGADFREGYTVLAVLVCGQLVNALAGPVGYLMMMTGHQHAAARIVAGTAALNLALNAALIPLLGMIGAAIATATSMVMLNLLMLRTVRLRLSLEPSAIQWPFK